MTQLELGSPNTRKTSAKESKSHTFHQIHPVQCCPKLVKIQRVSINIRVIDGENRNPTNHF